LKNVLLVGDPELSRFGLGFEVFHNLLQFFFRLNRYLVSAVGYVLQRLLDFCELFLPGLDLLIKTLDFVQLGTTGVLAVALFRNDCLLLVQKLVLALEGGVVRVLVGRSKVDLLLDGFLREVSCMTSSGSPGPRSRIPDLMCSVGSSDGTCSGRGKVGDGIEGIER
jgi:hypothetical protein